MNCFNTEYIYTSPILEVDIFCLSEKICILKKGQMKFEFDISLKEREREAIYSQDPVRIKIGLSL